MIISFVNHKGGTGKTTSVVNVGRALNLLGYKVLLIDLDPQGNLSYWLGIHQAQKTIADVIWNNVPVSETIIHTKHLDLLPGGMALYSVPSLYGATEEAGLILRERLNEIKNNYDFILIDCPPSISVYTLNALNASNGAVIPLLFEILSIQGLDQVLTEITRITKFTNPELKVLGVLGVAVNESRKLSEEVLDYIRNNYHIPVFNNYIRNNVKAAEAPSFGESILDYAPSCASAKDYKNVTNELLNIVSYETEKIKYH